jgi:flavin-dependent dehydrogenase
MARVTQYRQAIVVGAGPAGCAVAALLARGGVRVLLLERSSAPPSKICGEYLSPGCLPILDGLGALAPLRDAGARPLRGMAIHTSGGRTLWATYATRRDAYPAPPHALSVPRAVLDPLLLDLAVKYGADFEPGFQASDVLWHDGRVVGIRGRQRGAWASHVAPVVIGADGRHSVVARRIGAPTRHAWLNRMACVGYLAGVRRESAVGEVFLGRDRYGIMNPVADELTNVGLVINCRDVPHGANPSRLFAHIAESLPELSGRLRSARPTGPVRCLGPLAYRAARMAAPGALLVGDAAGFLDPFTGEGIYAALRSAELAAHCILTTWKRGDAPVSDFQDYAHAWLCEFAPKWRLATFLQHAVRRPGLAERLVGYLAPRPALTAHLMTAFGDLLPVADLRPVRLLLRLLSSRNSAEA